MMTKQDRPEELIQAKKLIDECKFDEAGQIIEIFEEKGEHSLYDIVTFQLLKCELLLWRDFNEDAVKLAEQAYEESLGLGKNLLSVDILLIMAHALLRLYQTDKAHDITKQGDELLKNLTQESPAEYNQRKAYVAFLKGWVYEQKTKPDRAIKQFELSVSLREELDDKKDVAFSLVGLANVFMDEKGDYDRALIYLKQSLALAEESGHKWTIGYCLLYMAHFHGFKGELDNSIMLNKRSLKISKDLNDKFMITRILLSLGGVHAIRGELTHGIKYYKQGLELSKEYNFKVFMTFALNGLSESYRMKRDLERALECIEQSMGLSRELGDLRIIAFKYDSLIQILIEKGDLERARISLSELEQLNNQLKDKPVRFMYLFNKAMLLKTSSRALNRGKAEKILKKLLQIKDYSIKGRLRALINLCELLLTELRITNDLEVLDELNQFISQLLELAEKSNSYWILCETYLIQAKLSLLTFNIEKAQRFLTQARQIADRFDLTQLIVNITNEKEEIFKKLDIWEELKEKNASMADRMELARLDEKIIKVIQNRLVQVSEEKVAIHKELKICLVCRGEVLRFTYICECGAIYCDNCARAVTDLENVCWVCDVPIDYSKPAKKIEEEEAIIRKRAKGENKKKEG